MMDIINIINESKKRTNVMNGIGIDWQYAQQLIPKVLNESKDLTPELKLAAMSLYKLFEDMEEGIKELKSLIPVIDQ